MASTASGWQYAVPNDTLVAWPAVSQAVADKLEISLPKSAGYQLIKTQTIGSGVSTVTVTGAFSATYDSYRIIITSGTNNASANNLSLKLGSSGGPYAYTFVYTSYGSGSVSAAGNAGNTIFDYMGMSDPNGLAADISVINPFLSKWTVVNAVCTRSDLGGMTSGIHKDTGSYTAFTIGCALGNLTGGTIAVYGLAKV